MFNFHFLELQWVSAACSASASLVLREEKLQQVKGGWMGMMQNPRKVNQINKFSYKILSWRFYVLIFTKCHCIWSIPHFLDAKLKYVPHREAQNNSSAFSNKISLLRLTLELAVRSVFHFIEVSSRWQGFGLLSDGPFAAQKCEEWLSEISIACLH